MSSIQQLIRCVAVDDALALINDSDEKHQRKVDAQADTLLSTVLGTPSFRYGDERAAQVAYALLNFRLTTLNNKDWHTGSDERSLSIIKYALRHHQREFALRVTGHKNYQPA